MNISILNHSHVYTVIRKTQGRFTCKMSTHPAVASCLKPCLVYSCSPVVSNTVLSRNADRTASYLQSKDIQSKSKTRKILL